MTRSGVGNALKPRFDISKDSSSEGCREAEKKRHERSEAGNCLRWREMNLEEQKTRRGEQPAGRLNTELMASGFRVEQNVGVEALVRGNLLAGERADAQRHGCNQPDEG